ncbi:MAG: hypothetical protein RLN75_07935, partial [Longimicrobiales bacterium]
MRTMRVRSAAALLTLALLPAGASAQSGFSFGLGVGNLFDGVHFGVSVSTGSGLWAGGGAGLYGGW